jgi:putative PIN family toxin of toxin-antitoxin system
MRRAVFDTTVLVSALLRPGGLADEMLTLAAEEQFELILSSVIILETWRTLLSDDRIRSQYSYSDERAHLYCLSLLEIAIEVLRTTRPLSGIVRDPRDDMVLACAVDGRADTVVSRDKDLLSLGAFRGIAIITPEVFRQQLRDAQ